LWISAVGFYWPDVDVLSKAKPQMNMRWWAIASGQRRLKM